MQRNDGQLIYTPSWALAALCSLRSLSDRRLQLPHLPHPACRLFPSVSAPSSLYHQSPLCACLRTLVRRRPPLRLGNLGLIPPHALELALVVVPVLQPMLLAAFIPVGAGQNPVAVSDSAHARGEWAHHWPQRRVCRMRERGNGGRAIDC